MSQSKILAFSHIPKTAGSSFNFLLRRYFGHDLLSVRTRGEHNSFYRFCDCCADLKQFTKTRCIAGHPLKPFVDFGSLEQTFHWFVFFRKPAERFISHYLYQQAGKDPRYHMDVVEWTKKFNRSNLQVQWLAGKEDLQAAIQILDEKISTIGITNQFDLSLFNLCASTNMRGFPTSIKTIKNRSRQSKIEKDKLKNNKKYYEVIQEANALDQQLYNYALTKFKQQTEKYQGKQMEPRRLGIVKENANLFKYQVRNKLIYPVTMRWK